MPFSFCGAARRGLLGGPDAVCFVANPTSCVVTHPSPLCCGVLASSCASPTQTSFLSFAVPTPPLGRNKASATSCGPSKDLEDDTLWDQPKKRAKRNESRPAVRAWFCSLTACHPDWSVAECIRYRKRLALELFQGHIQTSQKWLRSGHTHVRPAVLGPFHVTELVDLGQRISEGISCGSSVFHFVFNQRLEALGCTFCFGPRDCRRFLRKMNLKWREPAGEKRKWSDSDVHKPHASVRH